MKIIYKRRNKNKLILHTYLGYLDANSTKINKVIYTPFSDLYKRESEYIYTYIHKLYQHMRIYSNNVLKMYNIFKKTNMRWYKKDI